VPHVQLTHICNRQIARKRVDWVPASVTWTESAEEVLASDVDIVIELVGGLRPTHDWVKGALLAGKSVVTANKQLMARFGTELLDLARSRGLEVRFEASVAGGIPVLRALQEGLAGDRLVEVRGILNGTCAYILSRMQSETIAFADALAEAQKAGYAEADPSEDLDGAMPRQAGSFRRRPEASDPRPTSPRDRSVRSSPSIFCMRADARFARLPVPVEDTGGVRRGAPGNSS
jgi:homoserine dehydrogenase